jgi:CBS domain containing-hemolysin-like protein
MIIIVVKILITIGLVALNAFFVAAEFAAVSARTTRMEEYAKKSILGNWSLKIKHKLDLYLSTCQFGITVASLGLGFVAEEMLVELLEPMLININIQNTHGIAVVLAISIATALHVSVGEVAPKNAAIKLADKLLPYLAGPLIVFTFIFYPAIWILNEAGNKVLKLLGIKVDTMSHGNVSYTLPEIRSLLEEHISTSEQYEEKKLVTSALSFDEQKALHIMTPRVDVTCLFIGQESKEIYEIIKKYSYTRFPLYQDNIDNIIGFVHSKDINNILLNSISEEGAFKYPIIDLEKLKRELIKVPPTVHLDKLLKMFKSSRIHMAGIFNEYGSFLGIVTLEDVIEELVGDIEDEFDDSPKPLITKHDNYYIVNAKIPMKNLAEELNLDVNSNLNIATLNGFLIKQLDRLPQKGDIVSEYGYKFEIINIVQRKSALVKITKLTI